MACPDSVASMAADTEGRVQGSDELVAEIVQRYELGTYRRWADLGGSRTTNLRIDLRDRRVVARVHPKSTSPERLAAMQAARSAVARAGVPTATPIPLGDGASFTTLVSGLLIELESLLVWDTRMNNEALIERGHGELARVHDALRAAELPPAAATTRYANYIGSAEAVAASRRGVSRIHTWRDRQLSEFADLALDHVDAVARLEEPLRAALPDQVVHGDFWDNNVLFKGTKLVGVIDFDFMARRPRIEDLALTAYFLFLHPGRELPTRATAGVLRRFVDAYDKVATESLSVEERVALPLAIARQPAWSLGRWIVDLDEDAARQHATDLMAELPVAQAVLAELDHWQEALITRRVDA